MKTFAATAAVLLSTAAADETSSPVTKVLDLLGGLEKKIIAEGEEAQKEYDSYAEWCEDRNANVDFEIKTGKSNIASLKATIEEETATAAALDTKIEELAAGIATDESDLKAATEIREKEAADFATEEKELVEVIDTLHRATGILEREMAKGGAAMVQLKQAKTITDALSAMVSASMFSQADASQLSAFVQTAQQSDADDEDDATGAPAAAVYEGHSGGIIDTLEGLTDKAETQLADARKKEQTALHNFEMLKQSLEDQLKFAEQDSAAAKKSLAASAEKKAVAQGDLEVSSSDLAEDEKTKSTLHQDCLTRATDFEAATKSRSEELKALAAAKKVITETTSGAADLSYGLNQVSFLQVNSQSQMVSGADLAKFEAVRYVRDLARKENSPALAQLASQMASAMRLSSGSSDPFAKVKGLISQMIEKLESDASADASHKEYCDKELAESNAKKTDMTAEISKLSTSIDQMSSRSAMLKEQIATLQQELAAAAKSQAEWDTFRQEEKATYTKNKAEMEQGLDGVKMALKVLREYYSKEDKDHAAAEGSASGIVGLLEVVESDFSKGLAEMTATEESAQVAYDAATKENEIETAMKKKDVEYKTKESASLDKSTAAAKSDREGVQAELDAVAEYLGKLEEMCVAKAEPYSERKRRRDAEIAGLKEALEILEGEAVLLQTSKKSLRGVQRHN